MTSAPAGHARLSHVAVAAAAIGSIPIVLLTMTRDGWAVAATGVFWRDQVAAHARSILCVPALIMADKSCSQRLWRIIAHFAEAGLVGDRPRFDDAVARARRRFSSRAVL